MSDNTEGAEPPPGHSGPRSGAPEQDASSLLETAAQWHRAGRLAEAADLYRRVLGVDGSNLPALYGLAVLLHQTGDHAQALQLLIQAVRLGPELGAIWSTLAQATWALGLLDRTVETAREAIRRGSGDPSTRLMLARALRGLGRRDEALAELNAALGLAPGFAPAHDERGAVLLDLGRLDEARGACVEALRLAPDLATAHVNLALIGVRQGRFDEAKALLERAAQLDPNRALVRERLAELHERDERFDEAIACRSRVLALTPGDSAPAHLALGRVLQEENRFDEAETHYRASLAIDPKSADTRISLGLLQMERGDLIDAEASFREAIHLNPTAEMGHYWLAQLLGARIPDADLGAIEARLADPSTVREPRARLLYALGHVLDARGDYPRAAAVLREANTLNQSLAAGPRTFDPAEQSRFIDSLIQGFDRAFFDRIAGEGAGSESRRPVFVVGLPRSGTSLIEQMLASHPDVFGAGELALGRLAFETLPAVVGRAIWPAHCAAYLDGPTLNRLAAQYLDKLDRIAGDRAARVVDKLPENYFNLGILAALFPRATIIHCRRNLKDVALSCWMADFRALTWTNTPAQIGAVARDYLRLMDHWRATLPLPIHEVDYEETVTDLEAVARRLFAAMGLDWDPACLDFHRTRRPVRTASLTQVRQPIHTRSVARWKRYEKDLPDLFAALPDG